MFAFCPLSNQLLCAVPGIPRYHILDVSPYVCMIYLLALTFTSTAYFVSHFQRLHNKSIFNMLMTVKY